MKRKVTEKLSAKQLKVIVNTRDIFPGAALNRCNKS